MITIRQAIATDFDIIREIAFQTWPITYGAILSKEQLCFMLNKFYSLEYLNLNAQQNQLFFIISENEIPLGFLGIEHHFDKKSITKIHKIYVLPDRQRKGIGKSAYYAPTQNNLAEVKYPLARDLYIINCQGYSGLGMGFASFIAGDIGQRIILKSGLLPIKMPGRNIKTRKQLENKNK